MAAEAKRLQYVDALKSVAIIFIVFYHLVAPSAGKFVLDHLGEMMLAMFFVLSGFFFRRGRKTLRENIADRAKSTLVPFFRCSLFNMEGIHRQSRIRIAAAARVRKDDRLNASFASSFLPAPTSLEHTILHPVEKKPAIMRTILENGLRSEIPENASIPRPRLAMMPSISTAMTPVSSVKIMVIAVVRNITAIFLFLRSFSVILR